MAALLKQTEFAQLCGITPQAVSAAIKKERVQLTRGRIDPDHPTNRYFREQGRNRRAPSSAAAAPAAPAPPPAPGSGAGPKAAQESSTEIKPSNGITKGVLAQLTLGELDGSGDGNVYKNQVDIAKALEQMRALQLKNERDRNELISRELVKRVLSELYTVETAEFLGLAEKLGPEIAALFGVDEQGAILDVGKLLQLEISKTLEHIEMTIDKFLKSFQVEGN